MARLSVNLNKVALLRNSRHTGVPSLVEFAGGAIEAGARGITVHPRPDGRHILDKDVFELGEFMRPWRPAIELNLEGYPDQRIFDIVNHVRLELGGPCHCLKGGDLLFRPVPVAVCLCRIYRTGRPDRDGQGGDAPGHPGAL